MRLHCSKRTVLGVRTATCVAAAIVVLLTVAPAAAEVVRYVRFQAEDAVAYGIVEGETVFELDRAPWRGAARTGRRHALADVRLLAPAEPSKVLAVALNYRSHAGEAGAAKPELFAKLPSALIGPEEPIVAPEGSTSLHFEGELVVVIGRTARNISREEVASHVFGVTAGNDVSERSWQASDVQWLRAKASDGFAPIGPAVVAGLDYRDLMIETRLNGVVQQAESTGNLIHGVEAIVSYASRYFTLLPGDLIFTGTPGRTRAMAPGDVVEVRIEGIGLLRNPVAAPAGDR